MALILSGDTGVPASGMPTGSVIQTVQGSTTSNFASNSTSYVAVPNLLATITPISSTSKILVIVDVGSLYLGDNNVSVFLTIYRGGTNLGTGSSSALAQGYPYASSGINNINITMAMTLLDSPATTSPVTYQVYAKQGSSGSNGFSVQNGSTQSTITLQEIKA